MGWEGVGVETMGSDVRELFWSDRNFLELDRSVGYRGPAFIETHWNVHFTVYTSIKNYTLI